MTTINSQLSTLPSSFPEQSADKINKNQLVVTEGFEFMTPSLANFLYSLLAGALIIVLPATVALIFISQKDKIKRNI